jgi:hypothetical protein
LASIILTAVAFPAAARPLTKKAKPTGLTHASNYPKTRAAITSLETARIELLAAEGDFGGHKKDAVEAINKALKQLRLALQFARY